MLQRYCFALDLKDDASMISEYDSHHAAVWPEIQDSFRRAGIENVELYRTGNRLFMILETNEDFSFQKKEQIDTSDPKVQEWEALMAGYQQPLAWAQPGHKWVLMNSIFKFNK